MLRGRNWKFWKGRIRTFYLRLCNPGDSNRFLLPMETFICYENCWIHYLNSLQRNFKNIFSDIGKFSGCFGCVSVQQQPPVLIIVFGQWKWGSSSKACLWDTQSHALCVCAVHLVHKSGLRLQWNDVSMNACEPLEVSGQESQLRSMHFEPAELETAKYPFKCFVQIQRFSPVDGSVCFCAWSQNNVKFMKEKFSSKALQLGCFVA